MVNDILLLGSTGFVGGYVAKELQNEYNISTPTRQELDLCDYQSVQNYFSSKNSSYLTFINIYAKTSSLFPICKVILAKKIKLKRL